MSTNKVAAVFSGRTCLNHVLSRQGRTPPNFHSLSSDHDNHPSALTSSVSPHRQLPYGERLSLPTDMISQQLNGDCTVELAAANRGPLIGVLGWIEAAIAIKIMIARFLVRRYIVRKVDWNDWLMLLALVKCCP